MTTELVVAMPLLMLLILMIAQFAVWAHATHIAQAAAAQGLAAARVDGGTAGAGARETRLVLGQLGRGPLEDARVEVTRNEQEATVSVTGTASSVVPFLRLRVHAEAAGPAEVFQTPAGNP